MQRIIVLLVAAFLLIFPSVSFAQEQKGVKIDKPFISFLEKGLQGITVNLSSLMFIYPVYTPKELLSFKGKIYRGQIDDSTNYLIPLSYSLREREEITFYYILEKGPEGKPTQEFLRGLYDPDGQMGSLLKPQPTSPQPTSSLTFRLYFLKDGKIRLRQSTGPEGDFEAVTEIPVP
jgi:hypothetical protein